ncbi:MAG: beta-ketoacyl synthase N-terminal-like domain-containing protein, partial [Anaerolineaceae bacterium]|nr:beta-ketoacyl synthase N-terminal-like domain-containing protein [Anaerolineaceae bacterium]
MASIFPNASNLSQYWDNIVNKIDCIVDVPPSRWNIEDYYDPDPAQPDKSYCKRGGFIPDTDFDPVEFGLPPNILEVTDVSQLLGLVVARDALQDAGYLDSNPEIRDRTGVILGVVGMSTKLFTPLMTRLQYPVWEKVLRSYGLPEAHIQQVVEKIKLAYVNWEENAFPGAIGNVIAGRIANRFDLGGTNCVIDAACASSLAALRMAIMELNTGRADMMITGGVDTDNSIGTYMCFSKTPAFSKSEHVRPFDAASDGMMVGEGLGMLVLKRLEDAERDQDRIYAVIKAVGASSDGRYKSIYAPRPDGQARALRRAYAEAGFSPKTVGLIEAHGTGTMAGDPAEFESLNSVFSAEDDQKQHIALGSVKSQIGHTKATAGAASLIKTALSLYHKVLPPTINVTLPNPRLKIESTPFYLNTETRPWIRARQAPPRRAAVSSFGFGGTNYHVVLEEYQEEPSEPYRLQSVPRHVIISAPDPAGLALECRRLAADLNGDGAQQSFVNLLDQGRATPPPGSARVGFLAHGAKQARDLLAQAAGRLEQNLGDAHWELPQGIYYRRQAVDAGWKTAALFPGQGSQYPDMGKDLALQFPPLRAAFGAMDAPFLQDGQAPLSQFVYPVPAFDEQTRSRHTTALQQTQYAQPAIGALSVGMYNLLRAAGFQPDMTAGHSFGELTALWAAGVLDDAAYTHLAFARGQAMKAPDDQAFDAGAMLAVKGDPDQLAAAIAPYATLQIANHNSNDQVVLGGSRQEIAAVQPDLAARGFSVFPLPVSAAFHTPFVGHAQAPFAAAIAQTDFSAPRLAVYSNTTAEAYPPEVDSIRQVLAGHILSPVKFKDEIEALYRDGARIFVEIGPKNVLTNLVNNVLGDRPHLAIALNPNPKKDSDRTFREGILQLCVAGLDLGSFDPYQPALAAPAVKKKSPVTVKLNGGFYRNPKSLEKFEKALQEGPYIAPGEHTEPAQHPQAAFDTVSRSPLKSQPASIEAQPKISMNEIESSPQPQVHPAP